jgi:hypothetical protein
MLSSAVLSPMIARRPTSLWRVPVQTKLSFMDDLPVPQTSVWDQLDDEQKSVVIEILSRLITKMIVAEKETGVKNDG